MSTLSGQGHLSIIIAVLTAVIIGYLLVSDRLMNFINESNRQNKLREAQAISDEIESLDRLRNDVAKLLARITWDLARLFVFGSLLTIGALLMVVVSQRLFSDSSFLFFPVFTIILYAVFIFYALEIRRLRYIKRIYRFEEYKKDAEVRIFRLTDAKLMINSAIYGVEDNNIDVTERLRKLVEDQKKPIIAGNYLGGDPAPGIVKRLLVEYQIGENKYTKSVKEGEDVRKSL